ncbi:MAG: hypothetical protein U9N14_02465, partial [Pseudomonadota bacterium]|nr:hypothetical protein [Pseudomonadota bacterium]
MKRVFVPILIMAITTLAGLAVLAAEPDYYLRKPIEIEKRDKIKKFWLPDDIIFDPLTGQDPGTDIISSEERILGITRRVRIFPDSSALVSTKYRHKWTKPSKSAIVRARNLVRLHWTTPDLFDHTSTIKLYVRKNKKEDVEFGTWQVVTRSSLDPVPTFDPCDSLEGVALDVYVLSDPVVVTEFEGPLPVWTGNDIFEIGIGGEAPQSATQADPVMIMPDDSFRIGVTSSSTYATTYETRIHIGASSFDYSVTTEGEGGNYADQITPSTPVIPGTQIVSNPFDVQDSGTVEARADDDPDVEFCDNNCENEENWHNNITVDSYTLIKVRAMAPDGYSQRRVIIVKIGNKTAIYELETPEQDVEPDPFDFTDITGVEPNTSVQSDALALTGYDYPLSASITGHGGPQFQVNGGSWGTEAVLHENDTIRLRTTSNTAWEVSNIVSFTAGSRNDLWAVTTRERDITPSAFDFVDPIDHQEPETDVTSNIVTFTGFDGTLDVGVTGDDSARLRINGGNWVTDGQ